MCAIAIGRGNFPYLQLVFAIRFNSLLRSVCFKLIFVSIVWTCFGRYDKALRYIKLLRASIKNNTNWSHYIHNNDFSTKRSENNFKCIIAFSCSWIAHTSYSHKPEIFWIHVKKKNIQTDLARISRFEF